MKRFNDAGSSSPKIGREGGKQDLFIRQDLSTITNYPCLTLDKAVTGAPNDATVRVQPGHYELASATINKSMTLRAPLGGVVITLR